MFKIEKQHVFILGSKGIPAHYGGFETFVDKLTYSKKDGRIQYHVACIAQAKGDAPLATEFIYNDSRCFTVDVANIGHAKAIFYDLKAWRNCISYIRQNDIRNPVIYVLACRIGPFLRRYKRKLTSLNGRVFVNPDGHEFRRGKWNRFIKAYWKLSERLMIKHSDLIICDSKNIKKYIDNYYKKYNPKTAYIAYGAEIDRSPLSDKDPKVKKWYMDNGINPKEYYLSVGRFVPENNYEIMLREFMESNTEKDFVLITDAKGTSMYEKLKAATGFHRDSRVKFVGTVYDRELLKKIREDAYGYIHGHEIGGTNPSLLEALGSTSLNLLLDVSFNQEVAENGALYWGKESGALAKLINEAENFAPGQISEYEEKSTERIASHYMWEDIADSYENLFMH